MQKAGTRVEIVSKPYDLEQYDGLVLPGVGSFDPVVRSLRKHRFEKPIKAAIARQQPLLGICLGLQILFDGSTEGDEPGLGVFSGMVERFKPEPNLRIPHVGWNQLHFAQDIPLWMGLNNGCWMYFVHSYYVIPKDLKCVVATVTHGSQIVTAAVARNNLMATQFHPEKSSEGGLQILENFVHLIASSAKQTREFSGELYLQSKSI
ncbi:MAG: imidazole glycerol phosphate synthase subunit HisH [Symploca sp. SIO3C6]|nr:imidazole glycerol phosphate synthase subunit HisH [Symploca sp. SIO3C6]